MMDSTPPIPSNPHQTFTDRHTQIIDLRPINIPYTATDSEYRALYRSYIAQDDPSSNALRNAIESIKYGLSPPVAFPSETVYGLGHTASSTPGVLSIFATKGRPSDNPLIVHASSLAHLESLIGGPLPSQYHPLVQKYWPGPLTILLPVPTSPKATIFSPNIHPGQSTIAFRIPSSKYARFFIAATNLPIAGPSANSSGKPSPTTAQHVYDDLQGKVDFILDGGPCDVGVESTVVDGLHDPPLILRPGGVSLSELRALGGSWARTAIGYKRHSTARSTGSTPNGNGTRSGSESTTPEIGDEHVVDMNGAPRAPGMKYRHYAPQGRLILFTRQAVANGRVAEKMSELHPNERGDIKVGLISRRWQRFAGLVEAGSLDATLPNGTGHKHRHGSASGDNFTLTSTTTAWSKLATETKPMSNSKSKSEVRSSPNSSVSNASPTAPYESDKPTPTPTRNSDHGATAIATATATVAVDEPTITFHEVLLPPQIKHLAHTLFSILRKFDELGCAYIFAECVEPEFEVDEDGPEEDEGCKDEQMGGNGGGKGKGIGNGDGKGNGKEAGFLVDAVVDRLEKASSERVEE